MSFWVRQIFKEHRKQQGVFSNLLCELPRGSSSYSCRDKDCLFIFSTMLFNSIHNVLNLLLYTHQQTSSLSKITSLSEHMLKNVGIL